MSYIGNTATTQAFTPAVDYFSGNASTTAFTLSRPVASVAQVQVVVNNVAQNPSSAYTVSSNTITFTSAPSSGTNNIYVYYTSPITQVIAPSQGSVNTTALGSITNIASGNSSLTLQTGSGNTTAVTVDTSQNVGIGTSSPSYKLSVTATNTSGDVGAIQVTSPSTDGTQFRINNTGSGGHSYTFYSTGSTNGPGAGALGIYDQTAGAYRSVITSNGYLCLGGATSTTYNETLRIATANQQGIHINDTTSSSSINYQYFTKGSGPTNVGAIYYNGTVMAYQSTSDYRLKENVAPITNALNKISLLKPVTYTWKDNQRSGEGFLAHELQEHFPDAVSGTKDEVDENGKPKYQGVDSSVLIATMVKAIQEQQETINALTARIEALENK
jgi:hypothetical protein